MRIGYSQKESLLFMESVLGDDQLLPYEFWGQEFISDPFLFKVKARSSSLSIRVEKLLGTEVSMKILSDSQPQREFHGIVSAITQVGVDTEFAYFEINIVPRLSLLKYTKSRRIFQNLNSIEIIVGLLSANGIEIDMRLKNSYEKRNYCVQYDESDFEFISRLLESEGIFYYYTFKNGSHILILGDSVDCHDLDDSAGRLEEK